MWDFKCIPYWTFMGLSLSQVESLETHRFGNAELTTTFSFLASRASAVCLRHSARRLQGYVLSNQPAKLTGGWFQSISRIRHFGSISQARIRIHKNLFENLKTEPKISKSQLSYKTLRQTPPIQRHKAKFSKNCELSPDKKSPRGPRNRININFLFEYGFLD